MSVQSTFVRGNAVEGGEKVGSLVAEREDVGSGAFLDGQVELDARAVEVSGVIELVGALAHFFERPAGEARDVGGAQEAVLGDVADNVGVAVGELNGARRALRALAAEFLGGVDNDGGHASIVARGGAEQMS